jgi:lipoprotein-releasing system permease protein
MNLSLKIATRYLFAKKSTNAINVITGVSVIGLALGTTALVLV